MKFELKSGKFWLLEGAENPLVFDSKEEAVDHFKELVEGEEINPEDAQLNTIELEEENIKVRPVPWKDIATRLMG